MRFNVAWLQEIIDFFTLMISTDIVSFKSHLICGMAHLAFKKNREALDQFRKCLKLKSNCVQAKFQIGVAYQRMNRHQQAIQQFDLAAQVNKHLPHLAERCAMSLIELEMWKKAADLLSELLKQVQHEEEQNHNNKQEPQNEDQFKHKLKSNSDDKAHIYPEDELSINELWRLYGICLTNCSNYPEGISALYIALQSTENDPILLNGIGACQLMLGNIDQAVEKFSQSLQLLPTYSIALYNWGLAFFHLGDYAAACDKFYWSIAMRPNMPKYHFCFSQIFLHY